MKTEVEQKIEAFFGTFPLRTYAKGQILIHGGEEPEHIFYIVEGRVRQYDITYRGDEVVVNVFKPKAYFPMQWAVSGTPNGYFFDTETAVQARTAPRSDVVAFVKQNPDVLFELLTRVYSGMEGLLGRVVQLMSGSARSRLLYEILIECRRFGEPHPELGHVISISEVELAARAGLSRETVSREIKKIDHEGLVKAKHGQLSIRDIGLIERLLEEQV